MNAQPRILIFTGEGKGKTTAALGMVFRAVGHGMRACVLQFVKGDDTVGEVATAKILKAERGRGKAEGVDRPPLESGAVSGMQSESNNETTPTTDAHCDHSPPPSAFPLPPSPFFIELHQFGLGFLPRAGSPEEAKHRAAAGAGFKKAAEVLAAGQFSIVVLDEICFAVARGLLDEHEVIEAIRRAPAGTCVVLTGRYATQGLIDLADTVTEMRPIKHGMTRGIAAQKGVEW